MALTSDEQDLVDHARAGLPQWFFSDERANEELAQAAKAIGASLIQVRHWLKTQTLIGQAVGATSTEPDWLDQHAADRGTRRQHNETDISLRYRLRHAPNSITRAFLLQAVQEVLVGNGVLGTAYMVELPRDQIFVGSVVQPTGTGGTFTGPDGSNVMTFAPTGGFGFPPFAPPASVNDPFTVLSGRVRSHQLVITGSAGNDGTFLVTALDGDGAQYVNAGGAAGDDGAAAWAINRRDRRDLVLDGHAYSFVSRGERIGRTLGGTIIVILPFGTDPGTARAVAEMLRQRKGAGVILHVETRQTP